MQLEAERTEADLFQPPMHHFERCQFLRHEQHGAALRQQVRDQVGDGLALAGTGRALQHQVAAGIDGADSLQLRRVGDQRCQDVVRRVGLVQTIQPGQCLVARERLARTVDQVLHHAVGLELRGAVLQVLPHQVLREREQAEVRFVQHLPLFQLGHCQAERLQQARDVDALVVGGQAFRTGAGTGGAAEAAQVADADLLAQPHHLQQRRIDDRIVVMAHQPEAGAHRLAQQRHRHQQDRREMRGLRTFGIGPAQQAECEEQRVRTPFLQTFARLAEQVGQRRVQVLGREPDQQFAVGQRTACHLVPGCLAGAVAMDLGRARILAVHDLRLGAQPELAAVGQRILQRGEVGRGDAQRRLRRLEVEQPVAQGQVEQLRLPLRQPSLWRVVGAGVDDLQQCRVERGQVGHGLDGGGRSTCRGTAPAASRSRRVACGTVAGSRHRARRQWPDVERARAPDVDRI